MKTIFFAVVLGSLPAFVVAQTSSPGRLRFSLSGGINNHSYTRNYTGWYIRAGLEKKIAGKFSLGLVYTHTGFSSYPPGFYVYNFQPPTEDALLEKWKGITREEWTSAKKGFYKMISGELISLQASYAFSLGKRIAFIPRIGIGYIATATHTTGVFDALFFNDRLNGGRIGYDLRNSRLSGLSFGAGLTYTLNDRWALLLHFEDNRDLNGSGFNYYEAKQAGMGVQYRLSRK